MCGLCISLFANSIFNYIVQYSCIYYLEFADHRPQACIAKVVLIEQIWSTFYIVTLRHTPWFRLSFIMTINFVVVAVFFCHSNTLFHCCFGCFLCIVCCKILYVLRGCEFHFSVVKVCFRVHWKCFWSLSIYKNIHYVTVMNKYKVKEITWKNVGLLLGEGVIEDKFDKWYLTVKMAHICMISLVY